jgi:hypothetical protein
VTKQLNPIPYGKIIDAKADLWGRLRGRLYDADRKENPWTDDHVEQFLDNGRRSDEMLCKWERRRADEAGLIELPVKLRAAITGRFGHRKV